MSIIIPANTLAAGGFDVDNSCRFDDGSSAHMHITPGSDGSRVAWTFSTWIKRCALGAMPIFSTPGNTSNIYDEFYFNASDKIQFSAVVSGTQYALRTKRVFRDTSAWYHIVLIFDSNNSTAGDRMQLWINGVRTAEGDFEDITFKDAQNYNSSTNKSGYIIYLGRVTTNTAGYYDGYMSEVVFQNAAVDSPVDKFGEFDEDSGIWKPIDVSGLTFGTNGFYLDFKASGNLGNDANGGTDLTEVNLEATDQTTDTCTNNFMTLNRLIGTGTYTDNQVYSEGNTIVIPNSTDNYGTAFGTFGATRGKWYWEAQIIWNGTSNNANYPKQIGFMREDYAFNKSYLGQNDDQTWGVAFHDLSTDGWGLDHNGSFGAITGATTLADDKMLMFALDLDNGKFYMGYDGTFFTSGDPTSGATGTGAIATLDATDLSFTIIPALTNATDSTHYKMNFGNPAYAIASSNADGDGFGNFEFAVPSNYFSWCTKNLAEYG